MTRAVFNPDADQQLATRNTGGFLLCTMPGCMNRWTCDFGRRLCSSHDAARHSMDSTPRPREAAGPRSFAAVPLPSQPPAKPYAEVDDDPGF